MKKKIKIGLLILLAVIINNVAVISFILLKNFYTRQEYHVAKDMVNNVLQNHPEMVIDAVNNTEKVIAKRKEERKRAKKLIQDLTAHDTPIIGPPNAKIKIVQFSDYNCSPCKRMSAVIEKVMEENKNVQLVFRPLPKLGINSHLASKISLVVAVVDPENFLDFHKALMQYEGHVNESIIYRIAGSVGIPKAAIEQGLNDRILMKQINNNMIKNFELFGEMKFTTVPALVIGNIPVPHSISYNNLVEIIRKVQHSSK